MQFEFVENHAYSEALLSNHAYQQVDEQFLTSLSIKKTVEAFSTEEVILELLHDLPLPLKLKIGRLANENKTFKFEQSLTNGKFYLSVADDPKWSISLSDQKEITYMPAYTPSKGNQPSPQNNLSTTRSLLSKNLRNKPTLEQPSITKSSGAKHSTKAYDKVYEPNHRNCHAKPSTIHQPHSSSFFKSQRSQRLTAQNPAHCGKGFQR